jgi:hypothetical protein
LLTELYKSNEEDLTYSMIDIIIYEEFEEYSNNIVRWKLRSVVFFCFFIIAQFYFTSIPMFEIEEDRGYYWVISCISAYIMNIFIAYLLHKRIYNLISAGGKKFNVKNPFDDKTLRGIVFFLLSPDNYFAQQYKENIKKAYKRCCHVTCGKSCLRDRNGEGICLKSWDLIKIHIKYFVIFSNWYNVILAVILTIITILFWGYSGGIVSFIYFFVAARILSRFIEITLAFYKDVTRKDDKVFADIYKENQKYVHGWKNSLLLKSSRVSLAIHSLAEIILLYSILYYFIYLEFLPSDIISKLKDTIGAAGEINAVNFIFFSSTVSSFNFSFFSFESNLWSAAHVSQVLLSMVLIIMALATYLNADNDLLNRDQDLYLKTILRKLQRESTGKTEKKNI